MDLNTSDKVKKRNGAQQEERSGKQVRCFALYATFVS